MIHIWTKGEVGAPWNWFKPSCKIFLLTVPSWYFFLWIICVIYVLCLSCFRARLFIAVLWSPEGKGLTSWLLFVMLLWFCYFPIWYAGMGVVLDCIDSWSLLSFLLIRKVSTTRTVTVPFSCMIFFKKNHFFCKIVLPLSLLGLPNLSECLLVFFLKLYSVLFTPTPILLVYSLKRHNWPQSGSFGFIVAH